MQRSNLFLFLFLIWISEWMRIVRRVLCKNCSYRVKTEDKVFSEYETCSGQIQSAFLLYRFVILIWLLLVNIKFLFLIF